MSNKTDKVSNNINKTVAAIAAKTSVEALKCARTNNEC